MTAESPASDEHSTKSLMVFVENSLTDLGLVDGLDVDACPAAPVLATSVSASLESTWHRASRRLDLTDLPCRTDVTNGVGFLVSCHSARRALSRV